MNYATVSWIKLTHPYSFLFISFHSILFISFLLISIPYTYVYSLKYYQIANTTLKDVWLVLSSTQLLPGAEFLMATVHEIHRRRVYMYIVYGTFYDLDYWMMYLKYLNELWVMCRHAWFEPSVLRMYYIFVGPVDCPDKSDEIHCHDINDFFCDDYYQFFPSVTGNCVLHLGNSSRIKNWEIIFIVSVTIFASKWKCENTCPKYFATVSLYA